MKYQKNPIVVEAVRYDGTNAEMVEQFVGHALMMSRRGGEKHFTLKLSTPEGVMDVQPGDWVIKGVIGEFYPCKATVFAATYSAIES